VPLSINARLLKPTNKRMPSFIAMVDKLTNDLRNTDNPEAVAKEAHDVTMRLVRKPHHEN
jgi:hypothetical protein